MFVFFLSNVTCLYIVVFACIVTLLAEIELLSKGDMIGLTAEQVQELKLKDEFEDVCVPSGGHVINADPVCKRNGER